MKSVQIFLSLSLVLMLTAIVTNASPATAAVARLAQPIPIPGIKCISDYEPGKLACDDGNCDLSDPDHVFKIGCETDCKEQHGAAYGVCLGDVCDCGPLDPTSMARKMMCLNTSHSELFQTVCDDDCRCTHNRIGGQCNFEAKACECGAVNPSSTLDCPVKNANEYLVVLVQRYATMGLNVVEIFTSGSV